MSERKITKAVNKAGDVYHRHIYSRIAGTTARLTDYDFPLTDLAILPMAYIPEYLIGTAGYIAANGMSAEQLSGSAAAIAGVGAAAIFSYFGNSFRTPIDRKMGIVPNIGMNADAEIAHVIDRINNFKDATPIDREELPLHTYTAIDDFLTRKEGYTITASKRVKYSNFSGLIGWKHGLGGLLNPWLQEIVMFTTTYPEAIAHEQTHLKGIPQERLAEFVGITAQVESDNPYLKFLGYSQWLNSLASLKSQEWGVTSSDSRSVSAEKRAKVLVDKGLDQSIAEAMIVRAHDLERDLNTPRSYSKYLRSAVDFALSKMSGETRSRMPQGVVNFLRNFEPGLCDVLRQGILKSTGQKDIKEAYTVKPMQLLSAYRLQDGTI